MSRLDFDINDIAREENLLTKVKFYFSYKEAEEWHDPDEGEATLSDVNLNPITIKMYVTSVSAEKLYYKQYGQHLSEGKMILCDEKYKKYFLNASKIEIDGNEYTTFNKAVGSNATISKKPKKQISVVLFRK